MNGHKSFNSQIKEIGKFAENISNDDIKNEPMFFNCDIAYALQHGGPITQSFIKNSINNWFLRGYSKLEVDEWVFDSRVHMLMPGWYPCIPGFHHDDVPRSTESGQPNYDNPEYFSKHLMGMVNADICPTEFALTPNHIDHNTFPQVEDGVTVYEKWHERVMKKLSMGTMTSYKAPDRTLIAFDAHSFHQGVPAVANGWRWFGRLSTCTDRSKKVTNEIRKQVQVYLENPVVGW